MAANSLPLKPLNPDIEFQHISCHVIHILARLMAKDAIRAQLKNEGIDARFVLPRDLNERATAYLRDHPEVWKAAISMAHRIDEKEGRRKERQRLRREELRRRAVRNS
jgi:hypothetical protein